VVLRRGEWSASHDSLIFGDVIYEFLDDFAYFLMTQLAQWRVGNAVCISDGLRSHAT